LNKIP